MSNELERDIKQVELTLEQYRKVVKQGEALKRLLKNPDYKEIFDEFLFSSELRRLSLLLADPSLQSEEDQKIIQENIKGIALVRSHLVNTLSLYNKAKEDISGMEEELSTMRAEAAQA